MKAKRHAKILGLIAEYAIDTQEELLRFLNENGFPITQATVSRDIRELHLVKVQKHDGGYKYSTNAHDAPDMSFKFHAVFTEAVLHISFAENIVVIKCYTGMANAACAALDSIRWPAVVGTLAGDDTIFCVMQTKTDAAAFVEKLSKLTKLR